MVELRKQFAKTLKQKRLELGFDTEVFSLKTEIPTERILQIEEGIEWPSKVEIDSLETVLEVSLCDMAGPQIGFKTAQKLGKLRKEKMPLLEAAIDGLLLSQK